MTIIALTQAISSSGSKLSEGLYYLPPGPVLTSVEAGHFLEVAQGAGTGSSDKEMMREKEDTHTPGRQKRYGSTEVFMDPGFEETVSQLGHHLMVLK